MSKLQRSQMDKDGDGSLSAAELAANGFSEYGGGGGASLAAGKAASNTRLTASEIKNSTNTVALRLVRNGMTDDSHFRKPTPKPLQPPSNAGSLPRAREKAKNALAPVHKSSLNAYQEAISKFTEKPQAPNREEEVYQQLRRLVQGFA